ncbi:MAG TPA: DUF3575 domain-containing protein [Bacteroidia bacterium]|nr:DUF3575 domain-containing protein [Bacteroidia bacterium]
MCRWFFVALFLPVFTSGQSDSLSKINMAVKLNLASPFDVFNFPTISLGAEHRLTNRFSVEGEAGYQIYRFRQPDTSFVRESGYVVKGGLRVYKPFRWSQPVVHRMRGFYSGFSVFQREEKYNTAAEYTRGSDTTKILDYYWTRKSAWGIDLLLGYQTIIGERALFDFYAGIGFLRRSIIRNELQYSAENGDQLVSSPVVDAFLSNRDLELKPGTGLSLAFSVRIGYILY